MPRTAPAVVSDRANRLDELDDRRLGGVALGLPLQYLLFQVFLRLQEYGVGVERGDSLKRLKVGIVRVKDLKCVAFQRGRNRRNVDLHAIHDV